MQIHLHTVKLSRCASNQKYGKLLTGAMLSLFRVLFLLPTWKSDATKQNPSGMRLLWSGRPSWQPTKSGQVEKDFTDGKLELQSTMKGK